MKDSRGIAYPDNWDQIASTVKLLAGDRCVKCGHPPEGAWKVFPDSGKGRAPCDDLCSHTNDDSQRVLTVHHLDMFPPNCAWWNLIALCQVCHLTVQARYHLHQYYLLDPPDWLKRHIEGWLLWITTGLTQMMFIFEEVSQ